MSGQRVTDAEAVKIDQFMSDHMYHHRHVANTAHMGCDSGCRTRAIQRAVQQMLDDRAALAHPSTDPSP